MSRPEHQAPPEVFYNKEEASKYHSNSRITEIQTKLSERAIELLLLPNDSPCLLLDVGCGSCISGATITDLGHYWIGIDISRSMLDVALDHEAEGDVILSDMGQALRFRPGSFDGAISISAVQWLCNADKSSHEPYRRLLCFFKWLHYCLVKGARVALQFYPENEAQIEMITSSAMRSGFGGGLVVDFPNSTKAKKHFLVLWAGFTSIPPTIPKGLTSDSTTNDREAIGVVQRDRRISKASKKKVVKSREWIKQKKEYERQKGKEVRHDSKYTGRKRKDKF